MTSVRQKFLFFLIANIFLGAKPLYALPVITKKDVFSFLAAGAGVVAAIYALRSLNKTIKTLEQQVKLAQSVAPAPAPVVHQKLIAHSNGSVAMLHMQPGHCSYLAIHTPFELKVETYR